MSQSNTLFAYFQKTPRAKKGVDSAPVVDGNANVTEKVSVVVDTTGTEKMSQASSHSMTTQEKTKSQFEGCSFKPGDVVWAKLEGYPWWPSLVCAHEANFLRYNNKCRLVHVQFFDNPPTRGWVKERFVKVFSANDKECVRGGVNAKQRRAIADAEAALKLSIAERHGLLVTFQSSDDEGGIDEENEDEKQEDVEEAMETTETINSCGGAPAEEESKENKTPVGKTSPKSLSKRSSTSSVAKRSVKRRRIIESDSDHEVSDDEFRPDDQDDDEDEEDLSGIEESDSCSEESQTDSPEKKSFKKEATLKKESTNPRGRKSLVKQNLKRARNSLPEQAVMATEVDTTKSAVVSCATKLKLSAFCAADNTLPPGDFATEHSFPHLQYDFLQPEKIRDLQKHNRDDPDYDPKTLYVPDSFLCKQTPAMRQWWEMKMTHFDTVLFFKMGKFYELFHMDAVIAVTHLGLIYMKAKYAHSGFPEISYSRYSDMLIQKGFKVGRVEQTETPDMMNERIKSLNSKNSKVDKVVKRELCCIQTKGTKRFSFIDGDACDSNSHFLLAVCEKVHCDVGGASTYGVCFVDTSIGTFHIGQFEDDKYGSRLRTLIAHYPPAHVLYEKGKISEKTQLVMNHNLSSAFREALRSGSEFWDSTKTLKLLSESEYFIDESDKTAGCKWPDCLKDMISEADSLGHTAASNYELAVRSLGAVICHLKYCLMDHEILSLKSFVRFIPHDLAMQSCVQLQHQFYVNNAHMILDGVTLANLDVLINSNTGSAEGTLLESLQHCCTPFGKRLLKEWLCSPLCNPSAINDRLNAVEDLMKISDLLVDITEALKKLPDLERLLSKIHTLGSANRNRNHPDGRAILFEDVVYSKRKIDDFLTTLYGFRTALNMVRGLQDAANKFRSTLLRQCVIFSGHDCGRFPDFSEELLFFDNAFDHQKAKSAGVIKPSKGVDAEYDQAIIDILSAEKSLNEYLEQQKRLLGCRSLTFWGCGKNRYQLEVPDNAVRNVPDEYVVASQKKGSHRYRTPEIERLLALLSDAEDRRDVAQKDTMRRIFFQFDKHHHMWQMAIDCVAVFDVLISLSHYSHCGDGGSMSRPQFVTSADQFKPFLEIREGRHPSSQKFSGGEFIPNDTVISLNDDMTGASETACVVLVTGPNMGGKSTLMRQVGVIVILAQLGCYVPATHCRLTPVDRIFTRLGATDRIMAGESTFFVELTETAVVLQHATHHSLVLLDELGRGTATHDGNAIACAVVHELCENIHCRTLFSTHYHSLVEEFAANPMVTLGHMACMVENENDEDPCEETITFLYKFVAGVCPKSYGFNAARLANIPLQVIRAAHQKAKEFEESVSVRKLFSDLWARDKQDNNWTSVMSSLRVA